MVDDEIRERFLKIVDARDQQVVTIIEVLSPANKLRGAAGREAYLEKQREVLHSSTHLVEIDLLRGGDRVQSGLSLPPHEYLVHVSRKQRRPRGTLWPIQLRQRLPRLPIPLSGAEEDVDLDLQQVLNTAYDRAGYDLQIDYHQPCSPSLTTELAAWASEFLERREA